MCQEQGSRVFAVPPIEESERARPEDENGDEVRPEPGATPPTADLCGYPVEIMTKLDDPYSVCGPT